MNIFLFFKLQQLAPCLESNHLVFILEDINAINNTILSVNSINFAVWQNTNDLLNISYIDGNLNYISSYSTSNDINFVTIFSSTKIMHSKSKCLCSNGQVKLRVGIIKHPFYMLNNAGENDREIENGLKYEIFAFDVFDSLAKALKISYEVIPSTDNKIGVKIEDGWNGLIGMLDRDVFYLIKI